MPTANRSRAANLTPPPGATLPLVFQEVDPRKMTLTDEQKAGLNQLRQEFLDHLNAKSAGNSDANAASLASDARGSDSAAGGNSPAGDQPLQNWIAAQKQATSTSGCSTARRPSSNIKSRFPTRPRRRNHGPLFSPLCGAVCPAAGAVHFRQWSGRGLFASLERVDLERSQRPVATQFRATGGGPPFRPARCDRRPVADGPQRNPARCGTWTSMPRTWCCGLSR